MADPALEASSESLMETIEASTEKVIIDDPDRQCFSDTSIEKIEGPDVTVAADPASQSPETNEVVDDAKASATADPAPESSAIAEIPDAATGGGPTPPHIQDEAIAIQQSELEYLDFLRVALIDVVTLVAAVYGFVKNWAGLFRPIINRVDSIVVSPLCKRYSGVPFTLLRFADQEIHILIEKLSHLLPSSVKRAGLRVNSHFRVMRRIGLVAAAMNLAKKLYAEHETEVKAVWRWAIDYIPLFWRSVRLLLFIVIFFSAKYNRAVMFLTAAAARLPLVDVDRITMLLDGGRIDRAD